MLFVVAIAACGGGSKKPDAAVDAPAALMGLGQKCVVAMQGADCPANAKGCLSYAQGATMGICSTLCVTGGTMNTNAQGQIMTITPDPTAAAQVGMCTAAFTGTIGTAQCSAIVAYMPADNPLKASSNYTGVGIACEIKCGAANACPGGLTCNTTTMRCTP